MTRLALVALTMGEPSGIGGEIALKAWRSLARFGPAFFVIDDPARLKRVAEETAIDAPIAVIGNPHEAASVFSRALPVLDIGLCFEAVAGQPSAMTANAVIESIAQAVSFVRSGTACAVCTNPIQKSVLTAAGFEFPGHTEYLAHLVNVRRPVMMLAGGGLRVVPITIHVPLRSVPGLLTIDLVAETADIVALALRTQFGIVKPRLALAGLNPHAGENGTIGTEDRDVLEPAVAALRSRGLDIVGPLPADTLFHAAARKGYDVALCPTHDQALIPLKTLAFDEGVNITLGLPFVRTSPDHGTALDIVGKGIAKPDKPHRRHPPSNRTRCRNRQGNIHMTKTLRLGLNIDHVATVRNARGGAHPDPVRAALLAMKAGADGITAHLREDRRHIRDADMDRLKAEVPLPLNFEMAATDEMLAIALRVKPNAVCLVPERREEVTTEGGLEVAGRQDALRPIVARLSNAGIRVSLFIAAEPAQLDASAAIGAHIVEVHTGRYCEYNGDERDTELQRIVAAARHAHDLGLECHAGHGLSFDTVGPIAAIPELCELNIGHFLIGEAMFMGLDTTIREIRRRMEFSRGGG
jgi:4-hydroxythreonine-4-phosphate dehydrogenase